MALSPPCLLLPLLSPLPLFAGVGRSAIWSAEPLRHAAGCRVHECH
jgi:hypothetical protein